MRRVSVVLLLCVLALPAVAADRGFNAVVKGIEKHYGIRRLHPHLLGFMMFIAKPAMWGSGAHGMKLAVFEAEGRNFSASIADLDRIVADAAGPEWQPFVRVHERNSGESSVIYVSFEGKHMRMLIASIEQDEIAVVHLSIDQKQIQKWVDEPQTQARSQRHD